MFHLKKEGRLVSLKLKHLLWCLQFLSDTRTQMEGGAAGPILLPPVEEMQRSGNPEKKVNVKAPRDCRLAEPVINNCLLGPSLRLST